MADVVLLIVVDVDAGAAEVEEDVVDPVEYIEELVEEIVAGLLVLAVALDTEPKDVLTDKLLPKL